MSFDIFVINFRVNNFLPKLVDMLLFSMEKKIEFAFFVFPIFGCCPRIVAKRRPCGKPPSGLRTQKQDMVSCRIFPMKAKVSSCVSMDQVKIEKALVDIAFESFFDASIFSQQSERKLLLNCCRLKRMQKGKHPLTTKHQKHDDVCLLSGHDLTFERFSAIICEVRKWCIIQETFRLARIKQSGKNQSTNQWLKADQSDQWSVIVVSWTRNKYWHDSRSLWQEKENQPNQFWSKSNILLLGMGGWAIGFKLSLPTSASVNSHV